MAGVAVLAAGVAPVLAMGAAEVLAEGAALSFAVGAAEELTAALAFPAGAVDWAKAVAPQTKPNVTAKTRICDFMKFLSGVEMQGSNR